MKYHHTALATRDPINSIEFLSFVGYRFDELYLDNSKNISIQFCRHNEMPMFELIYPTNDYESFIDTLLKFDFNKVYHICYQCDVIEQTYTMVKRQGIKIIPIKNSIIEFRKHRIGFYYVKGIGLIELWQPT